MRLSKCRRGYDEQSDPDCDVWAFVRFMTVSTEVATRGQKEAEGVQAEED